MHAIKKAMEIEKGPAYKKHLVAAVSTRGWVGGWVVLSLSLSLSLSLECLHCACPSTHLPTTPKQALTHGKESGILLQNKGHFKVSKAAKPKKATKSDESSVRLLLLLLLHPPTLLRLLKAHSNRLLTHPPACSSSTTPPPTTPLLFSSSSTYPSTHRPTHQQPKPKKATKPKKASGAPKAKAKVHRVDRERREAKAGMHACSVSPTHPPTHPPRPRPRRPRRRPRRPPPRRRRRAPPRPRSAFPTHPPTYPPTHLFTHPPLPSPLPPPTQPTEGARPRGPRLSKTLLPLRPFRFLSLSSSLDGN